MVVHTKRDLPSVGLMQSDVIGVLAQLFFHVLTVVKIETINAAVL
jgi:hypothetical protein